MTTGPPAPDNRPRANGHQPATGHAGRGAASWLDGELFDSRRARLAAFWALVLRRFRAYVQHSGAAADRDRQQEGR